MRTKEPMHHGKTLMSALGLTILLSCARADDWPQWQGPNRNAISGETGLLKEWPKEGPPLAWRVKGLGGGDGAPSIAAGRIYGMGHLGPDEVVWALSEKDGKEIWVSRLRPAFEQRGMPQGKEGPGCTPTVDGGRLYVVGLGGDLTCLQASDGKVLWQKSMTTDFGGRVPTWSYRESPLVDGDKVIITPGAPDAMLVALDKLTGKTIWKSQMPGGSDAGSAGPGGPPRELGGAPGGARRAGGGEGGSASATVISGNQDPGLFESEHWGMTAFSHKIPNGNYLAKLYFAETYQGITGPGQRVFSFNVHGREFKNFDIWQKAGGANRAYIETVPLEVTNGEVRIAFSAQTQSPVINAIEIIPQATNLTGAESSKGSIRIKAGQSEPFKDSNGQIWLADQGFEGGSFGGRRVFASIGLAPGGSPGAGARAPGGDARGPGRPGGFGGGGGSGAAYSSIIAIDFEGQRQYVQLTARALIGFAASDGKFLWRYDRPANGMGINCSTPLYHDGRVFAASAYNAGGGLVRLSKDGSGGVKAEEVWFSRNMQNHHGGVVLIDGALYGGNGGNGTGYLVCLDFQTGEVLWNEGDPDKRRVRKGSMAVADGRIYYRNDTEARGAADEVILIEPSRKEYIERGRFRIPDPSGSHSWSHPVIANGRLYVRDQDVLLCYDVKAK